MKIGSLLLIPMLCLPCLVSAKERKINELPMYGGKHTPEVEQDKKISESAAKLGWQYYSRDDLDTAIKPFNQTWMFDRNSIDALWGFGLIQNHPG
ncbi:MAG: hypothetical protein HY879_14385 [Deltaproteobacteria bacterium]|nr:hypothetical protein [Deltaproteobacteria bacterium]